MKKGPLSGSDFEWTFEREQTLRRMWADGSNSGEIAETLGITRNAVVGKRNRLKLPVRFDGATRKKFDTTPYRRLPPPDRKPLAQIIEAPGWPTRAQLMGRRA